jgi:hypothetical protein
MRVSLPVAISQFFHDDLVTYFLLVVALDIVLGLIAAFKTGTFTLHRIGDFARDDLLYKFAPWAVFYVGDKVAGSPDVAAGIDTGVVAGVIYAFVMAQLAASILKSVKDIYPNLPLPASLAGPR